MIEKYSVSMRLIDGAGLKDVASRFNVTDGAITKAADRACRKLAAWLNSRNRTRWD